MPEMKQNPQVAEIEIGVRRLKTFHVYPLSVGQQLRVSDVVSETLSNFFSQRVDDIDQQVIQFFFDLFHKNLKTVLEFVLDVEEVLEAYGDWENLLDDMTNDQLVELGTTIKEQNFDQLAKKLKGPLKALTVAAAASGNATVSKGPSQESATTTPATA